MRNRASRPSEQSLCREHRLQQKRQADLKDESLEEEQRSTDEQKFGDGAYRCLHVASSPIQQAAWPRGGQKLLQEGAQKLPWQLQQQPGQQATGRLQGPQQGW